MPHRQQQSHSHSQSHSQSQVEQSVAQLQPKLLIILLVLLALLLLLPLLLAEAAYYVNVWLHIAYPCRRESKSSQPGNCQDTSGIVLSMQNVAYVPDELSSIKCPITEAQDRGHRTQDL